MKNDRGPFAAIDLKQVGVRLGDRLVLDDISLTVCAGERVALIGPNGSGKSTLLKLLTGFVSACHGEAHVLGRALHQAMPASSLRALRAEVGQVFQGLHLVQRLSARENVLIGSLARNRSVLCWARLFPAAEIARADIALRTVGLAGKSAVRVDQLSGGERQKTAIARMLMQSPRLVLADEPTAALDPQAATGIAATLSSLALQQQMALVTVVHDPGLLPLLADRVIGMQRGRIAFDLPASEIDDVRLSRLYGDQPGRASLAIGLAHPLPSVANHP